MTASARDSVRYTVLFAGAVCLVCAVVVSSAAVLLRPAQELNQRVDRLGKVLEVAGLIAPGEKLSAQEVVSRFDANIVPRAVNLQTGAYDDAVDAKNHDQRRAMKDPALSHPAPENASKVMRLPNHAVVFHVMKDGAVQQLILPVQGYGLWSTMYGYLALRADGRTVGGITFYEHGETPGLGGEVENPRWQATWVDRVAIDEKNEPVLTVIKGAAGPAAADPHRVDGLSGATITSRGVGNLVRFWLGPDGFGPFLRNYRATRGGEGKVP